MPEIRQNKPEGGHSIKDNKPNKFDQSYEEQQRIRDEKHKKEQDDFRSKLLEFKNKLILHYRINDKSIDEDDSTNIEYIKRLIDENHDRDISTVAAKEKNNTKIASAIKEFLKNNDIPKTWYEWLFNRDKKYTAIYDSIFHDWIPAASDSSFVSIKDEKKRFETAKTIFSKDEQYTKNIAYDKIISYYEKKASEMQDLVNFAKKHKQDKIPDLQEPLKEASEKQDLLQSRKPALERIKEIDKVLASKETIYHWIVWRLTQKI